MGEKDGTEDAPDHITLTDAEQGSVDVYTACHRMIDMTGTGGGNTTSATSKNGGGDKNHKLAEHSSG